MVQGARGARRKQPAGPEERSGDRDGLSSCGGRPLRMARAARKAGARDGRGGEARGAMRGGLGSFHSVFFSHPSPLVMPRQAGRVRWVMGAVRVLSYGCWLLCGAADEGQNGISA